jgi:Stealth protein CR2, conserved region 2/Stealth protein CR1, conserved region 1/Stealth protein CR3, conserved region 3
MGVLFRKARKLVLRPGPFFRDMLMRAYPIQLDERIFSAPKKKNTRSKSKKPKKSHLPESAKWDRLDERLIVADHLNVTFPIDVVYTWVDSGDPAFQKVYKQYAAEAGRHVESADHARFRSLDELRYAIRSVFEYAPWVRKIYIVTNGQVPSWLDTKHDKITVVRHDEILDEKYLPTFNSHVIESAIHRIPGIAEHYIYFNDDMLLTRPVAPNYFFSGNGLAYYFISRVTLPDTPIDEHNDTATEWGAKNARKLVMDQFGNNVDQMFAHTFYPQRKSVAEECERRWPEAFDRCRQNRFRNPTDILCTGFLFPHVGHILGQGLFTKTRLFYFNIRKREALKYYAMLMHKKGSESIVWSMCPNDRNSADGDDFPDYAERLQECLDLYYPHPSPAERPFVVSEQPLASNSNEHEEPATYRAALM